MRPLSIFSSDTFQGRIRLSLWASLMLVLVVTSEVVLRIPAVVARLPEPEPTLWHAPLVEAKMDYLRLFASSPGIDVLFIGNSTMQAGANPQVFDQVRKREQGKAGSFNGSFEGLPPVGTQLFLEIYLRYTHPRTIILGISPQDFNSNSPWALDVTERIRHSSLTLAEANRGVTGQFLHLLITHSQLFRYRHVLHRMLLSGGRWEDVPVAHFDDRGYHSISRKLADIPPAERTRLLEKAGVLNYTTHGEQADSLGNLLATCHQQGINVILVNMPLADDYYRNFNTIQDYHTYLAAAAELAADYQVPLWDFEGLNPGFGDEDFADLNHLNEQGAAKFSRLLALRYLEWLPGTEKMVQQ